jgi:glycosyltransferase A (GT-A) superfamily protein (DUF2064 family)
VHVLVMAKAPRPGRSKTRLCPPCTPHEAAAIAEAALYDTLCAVMQCGADRKVIALDGEPGDWLPSGFEVIPQAEGDFDHRLAEAWLAAGGPGLQIGMDTPQVTAALLDGCMAELTPSTDAVLGMALDGGWWAIGLQAPRREVFLGVEMSTPNTGKCQMMRLRELGLSVRDLPILRDIDVIDDAVAVAAVIPDSHTAFAVGRAMARPSR